MQKTHLKDMKCFLLAKTTKALRNDEINTSFDYAAEVMTGALLYNGGISELKFDQELKDIIKEATKQFVNIFPGKDSFSFCILKFINNILYVSGD